MSKTILITGSTDGIGFETAKSLLSLGHTVLLHGRNPNKLADVENSLSAISSGGKIEAYVGDLSQLEEVEKLAEAIKEKHLHLDVLINNAGVLKTPNPQTEKGLDVRFVVNTFAPYFLTQQLIPLLGTTGRVVNVSSAAQSPVNFDLLSGKLQATDDLATYAQSKLALNMWSRDMTSKLGENGPMIVTVNPGSLLASKMVKEGFGMEGHDLTIGSDILTRAALSDEFENASGLYFDNDAKRFADPHVDALNPQKCEMVVNAIETVCKA